MTYVILAYLTIGLLYFIEDYEHIQSMNLDKSIMFTLGAFIIYALISPPIFIYNKLKGLL